MKIINQYRVSLERLRKVCNFQEELDFFKTSLDASPLHEIIGQERAVKSMEFGLSMDVSGYNIFVVGQPGTGREFQGDMEGLILNLKNVIPKAFESSDYTLRRRRQCL